MILSSALTAEGACYRQVISDTLDAETIKKAAEIFDSYRERGTILSASMLDDTWVLTNERFRAHLHFRISSPAYLRNASRWLDCPPGLFTTCLKAYILMKMGDLELGSLRNVCQDIRSLAESPDPLACSLSNAAYAAEFLRLLPGTSLSREEVASHLDDHPAPGYNSSRRLLSDFTAYLCFHDSLQTVWHAASREDRIFLFPLWLWWNLTTILPVRPTEFVLTPYDCLIKRNGQNRIRIRRTNLKGGGKKISYSVKGDFDLYEYPVTSELTAAIQWYRDAVKQQGYGRGEYLFSVGFHYDYLRVPATTRRHNNYLYRHLKDTLRHYYRRFAPAAVSESDPLHLGDTRHLAMISLIISGGSPVICRELAGHDSIDISSHYYSNMASLVECATYEFYRKASKKRGAAAAEASRSPAYALDLPPKRTRVEGGWCGSEQFMNHLVTDCICSVGDHGEIGICENCRYFCPDRQGMLFHFEDTAYNRERVKADCWFLMFMTETVRKGGGTSSDLYSAFLRLQNSCHDYRESILHNLKQKEALTNAASTEK